MRTRRGVCYASPMEELRGVKRRKLNLFESLPDDLLISIFAKLGSSANSPSDLISNSLVCKRFRSLVLIPSVLSVASENCFSIRAHKWCESAHSFLMRCVEAGNLEACYILGMIKFYALGEHPIGLALMARAALRGHAAALYSLAVIRFNGSSKSKHDRDLKSGVALCLRAAPRSLDALREIAFCLQDGYGIKKCIILGMVLQLHSTCQELVSEKHVHAANQFLCEWFTTRMDELEEKGLKLCSHEECGRAETRIHEFRRCSVCVMANYCSRSCQSQHWRKVHKAYCMPLIELEQHLDVPE